MKGATLGIAIIKDEDSDFKGNESICCFPLPIEKDSCKSEVKVNSDGTHIEVMCDGSTKVLEKTKINLHDCLACGTCPNAEDKKEVVNSTVWAELLSQIESNQKTVIISLSSQSRCSLAAHFQLSQEELLGKLITFFHQLNVKYIFDVSFARELSLLESAKEFLEKFNDKQNLPVLASSCPGFIQYAESMHGDYILPYILTTKSPQQVMGSLVKRYFASKINSTPSKIFHCTVMPCIDRRMESQREQFFDIENNSSDVDLVLTTNDLLQLIETKNSEFSSLPKTDLDSQFTCINDGKLYGAGGGPSDGYLEFILKYAAKEVFGVSVDNIKYTYGKTTDFKETTLEVDGKVVLRFCSAYGFRNIQPIVRQIKQKKCLYDFVEVMACPSGCTNGGGQIVNKINQDLLKDVNYIHNNQPVMMPISENVKNVYLDWIADDRDKAKEFLHTTYAVEIKKKSNQQKPSCKCSKDAVKEW